MTRVIALSAPMVLVAGATQGWTAMAAKADTADPTATPAASGATTAASSSSSAVLGNGASTVPDITPDGRWVAFVSAATNLVPGDTNSFADVFVKDRQTGATVRASVGSGGAEANNASANPSISDDGRYVVFSSTATNLVANDTNTAADVFVRDLVAGTTTRVSTTSAGAQANNASNTPMIAGGGRFVAFASSASNLVSGDTNASVDVFVKDMTTNATTLVSRSSSGAQGASTNDDPSISADGRYVAYRSLSANLVTGDKNGVADAFLTDRTTGATTLVSKTPGGLLGNGAASKVRVAAGGRYVAFLSAATNLVANDTNAKLDVFVVDTVANTIVSPSLASNADAADPAVSADGRTVAWATTSGTLTAGDANNVSDVFAYDRETNAVVRVSQTAAGGSGNYGSFTPSVSASGRQVTYSTNASNLFSGDTNAKQDVVVTDRGALPAPDLKVTAAGSANPARYGTTWTDHVTVANQGTFAGQAVTLDVPVPAGTTFVSATPSAGSCALNAGSVHCDLGGIAAGANAAVDLVVTVSGTAAFSTTATAASAWPDLAPGNESAAAGAAVVYGNLGVALSAPAGPVANGATITYSATVANNGTAPVTNVVLSDPIPPGSTFVSATASQGSGCSVASGAVSCAIGTLAAGASASATIKLQDTGGGQLVNTVSAAGSETDLDPSDDTASASTQVGVPQPDLGVAIAQAVNPVAPGGTETYHVTVDNHGSAPATAAVVTIPVPAGWSLSSGSPCSSDGSTVSCSLGDLAAGASASADVSFVTGTDGAVTVTASAQATETDPKQQDNSASVTTTVGRPDLSVGLTASPDPVALGGGPVTWSVHITNHGTALGTNAVAVVTLPAGASYQSGSTTAGSCSTGAGVLTCPLGTLAAGASVDGAFTFQPTVAGNPTLSVAAATDQADADSSDNTASRAVAVVAPNLVSSLPAPANVRLGQPVVLHGTVANSGTAAASNTASVFTFPGALAPSAASSSAGSCAINGPVVTCSIGTLAPGASATIDLTAPSTTQVGTFTVAMSSSRDEPDADQTNDDTSAAVGITAAPNQLAMPGWQANAKVDDMAYLGDVLYVTGEFTGLYPANGGATIPRNHAAAIRISTQELLPWDPNVDGAVRAVIARSDVVYIGGVFKNVGGMAHNNLAAVDPVTGAVKTNNFNPAAEVKSIAVTPDGKTVYASGIFHTANGQTRNMVARWSSAGVLDGKWAPSVVQADPWGIGGPGLVGPPCPPRCFPAVFKIALAPDGQSLYLGGTFAFVNGISRNSAAQVSTVDGSVLPWDPNVYYSNAAKGSQNSVYDFTRFGNTIILCGDFFRVGGDDNAHVQTNVAAVDATTGIRVPGWNAHTDGAVNGCDVTDTEVILGGHFQYVGPVPQGTGGSFRNHVVAIDPVTGAVDPGWSPYVNSNQGIYAVRWIPGRLGIGGEFTQVQYRNQSGIAEFLYPTAP